MAAAGEEARAKPLYGRLVEIFGMEGVLAKSVSIGAAGDGAGLGLEEIEIEGQCGRCVDWFEREQKYVIETFEGAVVAVPEENASEWFPPPPEEGGFDLLWPEPESTEEFGMLVCSELAAKGFCVVQTFLSAKDRAAAMEAAEGEDGMRPFNRMHQEIEAGYMGYDNHTKVATLEEDAGDEDELGPLESCSRQVSTAGLLLAHFAPLSLGFGCTGLQNTMIRMSIDKMDEDELFPEALVDLMDEDAAEWSGHIQSYVRFVQSRKACILYMIENEGGDLWLYPKDSDSFNRKSVHIPISSNKMLIFRHDLMDYSYQARGRSLALQSWTLDELKNSQQIKEISLSLATPTQSGLVVINPGPQVPDGPKASIMSLSTRFPGECWSASQYWLMFASGTDTITRWPYARWDYEPYYEEGTDSNQTGKSYTCHGGFVSEEQITQLDNEFFGISASEARSMVPGQKMSLEVGYSCLVGAGFNKETLRGRRIGSWFGDVGPDWGSFQTLWGIFCPDVCHTTLGTSMSSASTSARLSHIFDLKGPVSSYDTACSASLVAMNAAHLLMFNGENDDGEALVAGVNTLLGPGSFIGNCMATMLSHMGRCFTFNRAADGYQRGEGCGAIFVKMFAGDQKEEEKRVCALIGTATNQDGRSASLTAPNGPAQQAVIRKSMGFAGINPNTVSIAECHGTGTALGDPIEVGALQAVMHNRVFPICKTSAKSNISHLEAGAGIAGLTKCIMMINMATAPPNCHFNVINAHLTVEGYPVIFDTECINTGFSSLYCGVSSFGFGGTNSRADVYGFASKGHKAAIKVELPRLSPPRVIPIGQRVFISGSWSNFETFERMQGGRTGTYTCFVVLGSTRTEQFQLSCDQAGLEVIHPLVPEADENSQIIGPDWDGKGLNFLIDGRKDGVPAGTVYSIEFCWDEDKKTISWKPTLALEDEEEEERELVGLGYEHRFYITGAWRRWKGFEELRLVADDTYEGTLRIGPSQREEFQIFRDKSWTQVIYPAASSGTQPTDTNVPVCGPDDESGGGGAEPAAGSLRRRFVITGRMHELVTVRLSTEGGQFSVSTTFSRGSPPRTWTSWEDWALRRDHFFFASGSFNGGASTPLAPDVRQPGLHIFQLELDTEGFASFQLAADSRRSVILCPDSVGDLEMRPGPTLSSLNAWFVNGMPRAVYEVRLDLREGDRKKMVTWEILQNRSLGY
mmetsp:Transcript_69852/g.227274  ORF Transcript_69852/g.227274 Transcript_69852/m.227274 type:complete len:1200 (-) Transcript_69852:64-3663(-)